MLNGRVVAFSVVVVERIALSQSVFAVTQERTAAPLTLVAACDARTARRNFRVSALIRGAAAWVDEAWVDDAWLDDAWLEDA